MCGVDVRCFESADFLAAKRRIVGHRQHDSVPQRLLPANLEDALPLFLCRDPWEPAMALNQPPPAYSRAKWMSCADAFFNQVVIEESDHREVLLQGCIRQRGSLLPLSLGRTLSDFLDVSSDHAANNTLKFNARRLQEC